MQLQEDNGVVSQVVAPPDYKTKVTAQGLWDLQMLCVVIVQRALAVQEPDQGSNHTIFSVWNNPSPLGCGLPAVGLGRLFFDMLDLA